MKKTIKVALILSGFTLNVAHAQRVALDFAGCWTPKVTNEAGSFNNQGNNMRAARGNTTRALGASGGIQAFVRLRAFAQYSYNEANRDVGSALGDFRRRRSIIGKNRKGETQAQVENKYKTDLNMLVISRTSSGAGGNGQATPDTGYSCIKGGRERQPTAPHEIGHNLSALHSHAHSFKGKTSLLGSAGRPYGVIVNLYSNPDRRYQGVPSGIRNTRENAKRISRARISRSRIR